MKNLIALAAILISSTSFAVSESDSRSEIKAAVKADHKLSIDGATSFVGLSVSTFNVCTDGENLNTTKEYPIYKRVRVSRSQDNNDSERDGYATVIVGYEIKSYPIESTQMTQQCANNGSRCSFVEVPFTQDLEKMVTVKKFVRTQGSEDREIYKTLFKKLYTIPACN